MQNDKINQYISDKTLILVKTAEYDNYIELYKTLYKNCPSSQLENLDKLFDAVDNVVFRGEIMAYKLGFNDGKKHRNS